MHIYMTMPQGELKSRFFPEPLMERLYRLGPVKHNPHSRPLTESELREALPGIEACIMLSWTGTPAFTPEVLSAADALRLIVTPGGSVAPFITDEVYERGIHVCSANRIMAQYTAEGALGYMLLALRQSHVRCADMQRGVWNNAPVRSLFRKRIGLVGLGTVGRALLELLRPFEAQVSVYDPFLPEDALDAYPHARRCSLEEALSRQDIVSLHASNTAETERMIGAGQLALLQDGALLVNTARGSLVDEPALAAELRSGRIEAVLDVYGQEPLSPDSELRTAGNAILFPHVAGNAELASLSEAILDELERYARGEPLRLTIPAGQYRRMSR